MNKIEQVARAIALCQFGDEGYHIHCEDEARAAIEAMRVPTGGMVVEGDISLPEWVSNYLTGEDLSFAFDAMIDAALEGK